MPLYLHRLSFSVTSCNFVEENLICYDQVVVELNALDSISSKVQAQLLNYLKTTGLKAGLLMNFSSTKSH
jgi:GxxExxY protein